MDVIVLAITGDKPCLHTLADASKVLGKPVECRRIDHAAPVFGNKHQMHL